MAKIVDPDALAQTTDVVYDTAAKTIQIKITGAISDDSPGKTSGVTGRCIYSFTKEEWKTDAALNKFKFPIKMIYEASFQLINGWTFADAQSIDVLRDAGFQTVANGDERACIISLGDMDAPSVDQAYYANVVGFDQTTSVFDKTGELNENIVTWLQTGSPDVDTRDYLKLFLREQGKTYAEYALLTEQGLSGLGFEAYKLPLSNGTDLKVTDSDATVDGANNPYQNMSIDYLVGNLFVTMSAIAYLVDDVVFDSSGRWFICTVAGTATGTDVATGSGTATFVSYGGERQIGSTWYAFNRIIDGDVTNTATGVQAHTYAQRQLRKTTDINGNASGDNFGTVNGNVGVPLTSFIGDQLHTDPGTYIDYLHADDNNSVSYWDITVDGGGLDSDSVPLVSTERQNPFFASFTLSFSANLVSETNGDTQFKVYFTNDDAGDNAGNDFDTSGALIVKDKDLVDITDGGSGINTQDFTFQYDYSGNVQRGTGSDNTDAPITVQFQGLNDSEASFAQFTIQQATGQTFACNTPDELNYDNP